MPCNLLLDPFHFQVVYQVNGNVSPTYQVFPWITSLSPFNSSPFNSELTPFLIPAAAERFGFNAQADSTWGSDPVYWRITIRFFLPNSNTPIESPGDLNVGKFSSAYGNVTPILNPGQSSDLTGFTGFDTNKTYLFHPKDLPPNIPVRLEITLSAYTGPDFKEVATDTDLSNNVLNFWLMRL